MSDLRLSVRYWPVAMLPDGYFKERLTQLVSNPKTAMVTVVAKEGGSGKDWGAYIGWPAIRFMKPDCITPGTIYYCEHISSIGDVMGEGDKLSKDEAMKIFPEFADLLWRR